MALTNGADAVCHWLCQCLLSSLSLSQIAHQHWHTTADTYLGENKIVTEDYMDIDVKLDYTGCGNALSGFDRFGRVVDQVWAYEGH